MLSRTAITTLTCAAALAAAAPAASADSISYVKDGDVFLTTPDGSRTFQVTHSGRYSYASQSDDGTIVALAGEDLYKLDRLGNVVADFKTPVSDGPPPPGNGIPSYDDTSTNYFNGPFDPEISDDGTKVAYTYYWQHYTYDPVCTSGGGCMRQRLDSGTALTHPDRLTAWDEMGGNLTGWVHPSWISDDELLRSEAGVPMSENAVVSNVATGELNRWFRFGFHAQWRDMALARQKDKLAMIVEHGDLNNGTTWYLEVWRTGSGTAAPPDDGCFTWEPEDGSDPASPTWSPDGAGLAFEDGQGIHVMAVPDQSAGCRTPDSAGSIVAPAGAKAPDWGPAGVPEGRPAASPAAPSPAVPSAGAPARPAGGAAAGAAAGSLRVSVSRRGRNAVTLRVAAPGAGRLTATGRAGGKVVARGGASAKKAGPVALRLRVARKARAMKVAVRFAPKGGGAAQTKTLRVRLAR